MSASASTDASISAPADDTTSPPETSNDNSGDENKIKRTGKKPSSNLQRRMSK